MTSKHRAKSKDTTRVVNQDTLKCPLQEEECNDRLEINHQHRPPAAGPIHISYFIPYFRFPVSFLFYDHIPFYGISFCA